MNTFETKPDNTFIDPLFLFKYYVCCMVFCRVVPPDGSPKMCSALFAPSPLGTFSRPVISSRFFDRVSIICKGLLTTF